MRLSDIMGRLDLAFFPQIALLLFLAVFVGVTVRLYARGRTGEMEAASRIPLEDDVVAPREAGASSNKPAQAPTGRAVTGA